MENRITAGVYPVHNNVFKIGTSGRNSTAAQMKTIADLETFSPSFDNNVEEWTPLTTGGWVRRLMTGKGVKFSMTAKRNIGDAGNDYVAGKKWQNGQDTESIMEWDLPDGTVVLMPCLINVTGDGGDSNNVNKLEFELLSNGAPTISADSVILSSFSSVEIGGSSTIRMPITVTPSNATITASAATESDATFTPTVADGYVAVTVAGGVAEDVGTITVTASSGTLTAATQTFTVTVF